LVKSPAFQFYPSDWISSRAVRMMDAEQRGWYIQLLAEAWESDVQGSLPDDEDLLKRLAGVNMCSTDVEQRWRFVKNQFRIVDGTLIQDRLLEEIAKQEENRKKKSRAGQKSGQVRRKKREHYKKQHLHKLNTCSTDVEQSTNTRPTESNPSSSLSSSPPLSPSHKKINIYSPDAEEMRLSQLLFGLIQERNPKHKQPHFQQWAREIDLMIRKDNRAPGEIEKVIRWSQADSFWQNNILSTSKLREKFDQMWLKINSKPQEKGNSYDPTKFHIGTDFADKDYRQGIF